MKGKGKNIKFPKQISGQWATTTGLIYRSKIAHQVKNVFTWLIENSTPEWVQLYATDILNSFKKNAGGKWKIKTIISD